MKSSYETIQEYVEQYQQGNIEAGALLLESFAGYLAKFHRLICHGHFNIHDKAQRIFVGLFIKEKTRLHQYKRAPSARFEMYKAISLIRDSFKDFDSEDIQQELIITLLTLAKRYRNHDGLLTFPSYMQKAFHFEFYRQLQNNSLRPHHSLDEESVEGTKVNLDSIIDESHLATVEDTLDSELDENWVNGLTCSELFEELTVLERKILRWHYINKLSDQEIADKIGLCRATINRRRLAVKERIANACKQRNQDN